MSYESCTVMFPYRLGGSHNFANIFRNYKEKIIFVDQYYPLSYLDFTFFFKSDFKLVKTDTVKSEQRRRGDGDGDGGVRW